MSETVTIVYCGEPVSVPKEVADFLEQDQKREQAQTRQNTRHLSRSEFETELSSRESVKRPVEDEVLRNLRLENLRKAMEELDQNDQGLLYLRYDDKLTMEEIDKVYGISKMAISKRLRKLHEKLRGSA
jgi:RNA polymerase sigma factor (sigma-70 family)